MYRDNSRMVYNGHKSNAMTMTSRTEQREKFEGDVRISLLETDVDNLEYGIRELGQELKRGLETVRISVQEAGSKQDQKSGKQNAILVGILVSITTASVLLALNLIINEFSKAA